jgi:hypothetical protein
MGLVIDAVWPGRQPDFWRIRMLPPTPSAGRVRLRQWRADLQRVDEALDEATKVVDLVSKMARWYGWDFITPAEADD